MIRTLFYLLTLLGCQIAIAQNFTVHITDSKNGENIAYANIKTNEKLAFISNAEGYFSISESIKSDDSLLTISHLGYLERKITIGELKAQNNTILLEPIAFELETVYISNEKPDAYKIMNKVKQNLQANYPNDKLPSKQLFFLRESNSLKPIKLNIEITKSSGYTKKGLLDTNVDLNVFTSKLKSHPPVEFKDILCNQYRAANQNKKAITSNKLEVLKATILKNGDQSVEIPDMKQIIENIVLKHIDTTKYYRFKSGLFGSRDTISFRKNFNDKKNETTKRKLSSTKTNLLSIMSQNNFIDNDKLNFVTNPALYNYEYVGKINYDQDESVYVLKFKPRKYRAKYVGKLYVSATDYAVLRCDYNLIDEETLGGLNMKFLLGIKTIVNKSKGTVIFKKKTNNGGYYLHYFAMETGRYLYINRPLKLIELTNSEKDVAAFDFEIEGNETNKTEFLNVSSSTINQASFENFKEKEFKYITLKRYDPTIWKDYITLEPLEEMKQISIIN